MRKLPIDFPHWAIVFTAGVILLAGCAPTPQKTTITPPPDYQSRARHTQNLAATMVGEMRENQLLDAAEDWLRAGQIDAAEATLQNLSGDNYRVNLLRARIAAARGAPAQVLSILAGVTPTQPQLQVEFAKLRATALRAQNRGVAAARELAEIAPLLTDSAEVRANRTALWEALEIVPDAELIPLSRSDDPILGPWAELARLQRANWGKPAGNSALHTWQARHNPHPVTQQLIQELWGRTPHFAPPLALSLHPIPSPVGLVLPADGAAARAARAVREGFMAAWYALPENSRPVVTFHPFRGGAVTAAYQAAIESGAVFIVGPLAKDEIQTLVSAGNLARPTLALNYLAEGARPTPQLYQFGLAPGDEARQAAQQARLDGHQRAAIITPAGEWGERLVRSFRDQWESSGGTVAATVRIENRPTSLSAEQFSGADLVFLATPPEIAQRLAPFLRSTQLPIYATSHILSGTASDANLPDLQVVELPWIVNPDAEAAALRASLERLAPRDFQSYRRIYALGIDAFRLLGELPYLAGSTTNRVQGVTGMLALDNHQRIVRHGVWAHLKNGRL